MNTSHTRGPWFLLEGDQVYSQHAYEEAINNDYEHDIALGKAFITGTGGNEANAKLIAAAPDLLEALQELLRFDSSIRNTMINSLQYPGNILKALDNAQQAIKKATE